MPMGVEESGSGRPLSGSPATIGTAGNTNEGDMSTNRKANGERGSPPAPALSPTPVERFLVIDRDCLEALGPIPAVIEAWVRFRGTGSEGCYQSLPNIGEATGTGERQLRTTLSLLVETGWLSAMRRVGRPTLYQAAPSTTRAHTAGVPRRQRRATRALRAGVPVPLEHTPRALTAGVPVPQGHPTSTRHKNEFRNDETSTSDLLVAQQPNDRCVTALGEALASHGVSGLPVSAILQDYEAGNIPGFRGFVRYCHSKNLGAGYVYKHWRDGTWRDTGEIGSLRDWLASETLDQHSDDMDDDPHLGPLDKCPECSFVVGHNHHAPGCSLARSVSQEGDA